ncbi:MAG: hypothetical protein AB8G18_07170 [Gammaproteobacteria bacterium]
MTPFRIFLLVIVVPIACAVMGAVVTHTVGADVVTRDWSDISLKAGMAVGVLTGLLIISFGDYSYWDDANSKAVLGIYAIVMLGLLMFAQYLTSCAFGKC